MIPSSKAAYHDAVQVPEIKSSAGQSLIAADAK
jgi:hypothetical protein